MGYPWVRMDSNVAANDKIADLVEDGGVKGKAAGFVYLCALGYAAGQETDGFIRRSALKFIHGVAADAELLVQAGLWVVVEDGWAIKNYGNRNVVGASQQAAAEDVAAKRSEAGKKGADGRWP